MCHAVVSHKAPVTGPSLESFLDGITGPPGCRLLPHNELELSGPLGPGASCGLQGTPDELVLAVDTCEAAVQMQAAVALLKGQTELDRAPHNSLQAGTGAPMEEIQAFGAFGSSQPLHVLVKAKREERGKREK